MNIIYKLGSSIKFAVFLVVIYLLSIGFATFVENDFGTEAAKWLIYQSRWFNVLHFFLVINMILVIIKYQMYRPKRITIMLFHLGFIITIIGAGITRFISFEGIMHIRVNETENSILSYPTYLNFKIDDGKLEYVNSIPLNINPLSNIGFNEELNFNGEKFTVSLERFIPNAGESIIETKGGYRIIRFIIADNEGEYEFILKNGESKFYKNQKFSFNDGNNPNSVNIFNTDSGIAITNPYPMAFSNTSDSLKGIINSEYPTLLKTLRIYSWNGKQFRITKIFESAKTDISSQTSAEEFPLNALILKIKGGKNEKIVSLFGKETYKGSSSFFNLENYNFEVSYGSKEIELPFSLKLNNFKLERYAGSNSPSSYESFITLNDKKNNFTQDYKIFMNNVLSYNGFRFYQSSFDPDEKGTILSVNHDGYGTILTYLGYFLLAIGMFLTIFNKNSRFKTLNKKIKEMNKSQIQILLILFFVAFGSISKAQILPLVTEKHAEKFGELLVQDKTGRIKPVNTTATELIQKLSKISTYKKMNAEQVMLSIMLRPDLWMYEPIIKVTNADVIRELNVKNNHISITNVFNEKNEYLIKHFVDIAYSKTPAKQTKFDKEIIKIDEKINILYLMINNEFLNIFPKFDDENNKWYNINNSKTAFKGKDSIFVQNLYNTYILNLKDGVATKKWAKADSTLQLIKLYQEKNGSKIIVNYNKISAEIFYNKTAIFRHLFEFYFIIGLVFLAILFVDILIKRVKIRIISAIFFWTIFLAFLAHTFGLVLRWYISGHAPWSDGYESMIYISWSTMFAGILFYKSSKISLAATTVLSGMILLVAHLSWIDPEITNLIPVLKSYWLTIHVAVITASYGFVALGALIGFINLIFMMFLTKNNNETLQFNIQKLTYINEMTLIAGLFLLTIGTFLGGVWANESWGRYWGWDSKETWALVTMLVYTTILHFRFIPKLKSIFTFNLASLLAFSSVLMTYFGVNFYLSGLHSYAKGDPVPIPNFIYYILFTIFLISIIAYFKQKKIQKN